MAKQKWTVEFEVDDTWVADGFELTKENAFSMLWDYLPFAYANELGAQVVSAPDPAVIRKLQGYED